MGLNKMDKDFEDYFASLPDMGNCKHLAKEILRQGWNACKNHYNISKRDIFLPPPAPSPSSCKKTRTT